MTASDLPAALRSPWALFALINHARGSHGVDVERRWAGDLLAIGMASDAVVALAILRDEEWLQTFAMVEAILRELHVDPSDTPKLLRLIRSQLALAIENGADPRDQARMGMELASEFHGHPGYDGALDVFYWLDDEFDLVSDGIKPDPSLSLLGPTQWALKQLREHP